MNYTFETLFCVTFAVIYTSVIRRGNEGRSSILKFCTGIPCAGFKLFFFCIWGHCGSVKVLETCEVDFMALLGRNVAHLYWQKINWARADSVRIHCRGKLVWESSVATHISFLHLFWLTGPPLRGRVAFVLCFWRVIYLCSPKYFSL